MHVSAKQFLKDLAFTLSAAPVAGTAERSAVSHPEYLRELRVGDEIWMDDGMIQLKVEETSASAVRCRVIAGGRISDHKGISFPHVPLPVSCLTPKDREDLRFGIHSADRVEDLAVDCLHGFAHALAQIAGLVAIPKLDGFVRAGRGPGRHAGAAARALIEHHVDLDGRIAAAIQNLASNDVDDRSHGGFAVALDGRRL